MPLQVVPLLKPKSQKLLDRDTEGRYTIIGQAEKEAEIQCPKVKDVGVEIEPHDRVVGAIEDHGREQPIVVIPVDAAGGPHLG